MTTKGVAFDKDGTIIDFHSTDASPKNARWTSGKSAGLPV